MSKFVDLEGKNHYFIIFDFCVLLDETTSVDM